MKFTTSLIKGKLIST